MIQVIDSVTVQGEDNTTASFYACEDGTLDIEVSVPGYGIEARLPAAVVDDVLGTVLLARLMRDPEIQGMWRRALSVIDQAAEVARMAPSTVDPRVSHPEQGDSQTLNPHAR